MLSSIARVLRKLCDSNQPHEPEVESINNIHPHWKDFFKVRDDLVTHIAVFLENECKAPEHDIKPEGPLHFSGVDIPPISILNYAERLAKHSEASEAALLGMVLIIERYKEHLALHLRNIHRLMITSLCIAAKLIDDDYFSNVIYARVGGVKDPSADDKTHAEEINQLEIILSKLFNWDFSFIYDVNNQLAIMKKIITKTELTMRSSDMNLTTLCSKFPELTATENRMTTAEVKSEIDEAKTQIISVTERSLVKRANLFDPHYSIHVLEETTTSPEERKRIVKALQLREAMKESREKALHQAEIPHSP